MYFLRSLALLPLILYAMLSLAWMIGGWLLVKYTFHLRRHEQLVAGIALGWLLFVVLSNLMAHMLALPLNFWAAGILILAGGIAQAWRSAPPRTWLGREDLRQWPQLIWLGGLIYLFEIVNRGVAIFDDYLHLPLVSRMAAGDIPPHFYLNADLNLAYHYGLQVWAASLVRMANFFPWSAWDISKAVAIAFTLMLGWLWARRMVGHAGGAYLGSFLISFGGGARWLLLLLPLPLLAIVQDGVQLSNTGAATANHLITALSGPWVTEGAGNMPFPFAFHNGIFTPLISNLGSTGAMPFMTVLLMLLLLSSMKLDLGSTLITTLLFASLALNAEHLFAFLWAGVALVLLLILVFKRLRPAGSIKRLIGCWAAVLALSAVMSLVQGGFITETLRTFIASLNGSSTGTANAYSFSLRWPPSLYSAHLGVLSWFDWRQVIALLAELGPALLLIPVTAYVTWRSLKRGAWFSASLGFTAIGCFFFAVFFQYGVDRSSTRFPSSALWISLCLCLPVLFLAFQRKSRLVRSLISAGYITTTLGAVVMFSVMLTNTVTPQLSNFIDETDAQFSKIFWNSLGQNDRVLDMKPERAATLFGRSPKAYADLFVPLPSWTALVKDPDPKTVLRAGYRYIYMDRYWFSLVPDATQRALQGPCVKNVENLGGKWLLDLSGCR